MQMLKHCLNWKVIAGLAAVGIGIYFVAPNLVAAALPILVLAICPLSMLLMMWGMQGGHSEDQQASQEVDAGLTREEHLTRLRWRQAALAERINELEQDEPQAAKKVKER
jgi:hypothetical protein